MHTRLSRQDALQWFAVVSMEVPEAPVEPPVMTAGLTAHMLPLQPRGAQFTQTAVASSCGTAVPGGISAFMKFG